MSTCLCVKTLQAAAQHKSMNECSEVNKTSTDFPCSGSRKQWTLCRNHIKRNTVHARSSLLMSWLSESGVLTKRDMQNGGGGGGGWHKDWDWEALL